MTENKHRVVIDKENMVVNIPNDMSMEDAYLEIQNMLDDTHWLDIPNLIIRHRTGPWEYVVSSDEWQICRGDQEYQHKEVIK